MLHSELAKVNRKAQRERSMFNNLVPPAIQQEFDLGIRNDLHDEASGRVHRGWRGIQALDPEAAMH